MVLICIRSLEHLDLANSQTIKSSVTIVAEIVINSAANICGKFSIRSIRTSGSGRKVSHGAR